MANKMIIRGVLVPKEELAELLMKVEDANGESRCIVCGANKTPHEPDCAFAVLYDLVFRHDES